MFVAKPAQCHSHKIYLNNKVYRPQDSKEKIYFRIENSILKIQKLWETIGQQLCVIGERGAESQLLRSKLRSCFDCGKETCFTRKLVRIIWVEKIWDGVFENWDDVFTILHVMLDFWNGVLVII